MVDYSELSVSLPNKDNSSRAAYRTSVSGIIARIDNGSMLVKVVDLSVTGCCIKATNHDFVVGRILHVDLINGNKIAVSSLQMKVVRLLSDHMVASIFCDLPRHKEFALDKLMLEIQKRDISKSNQEKIDFNDGEISDD